MTHDIGGRLAFALLSVSLIVAAGPASANNKSGQFAVEGSGRATCVNFTAARANKTSAPYERMIGFVEGYMTAANRYEANTFDLSPWHNAEAFALILDHHCKSNPNDSLATGVQKMVASFQPIRLAEFSQLVEVGDGKNKTFVYEAILRRAQAALKRRGLYAGQENGRYSSELRLSLVKFQQSAKLQPSGLPDPATLWTLLNP